MSGFWFSLYYCTAVCQSSHFILYHTGLTRPHLTVSGDALVTTLEDNDTHVSSVSSVKPVSGFDSGSHVNQPQDQPQNYPSHGVTASNRRLGQDVS